MESRSGPVVVAACVVARVEGGILEAAARVGAGRAARILKRTQAAEIGLAPGQGGCLGGAERPERLMPTLEGIHQRAADHHAARDARRRGESAAQNAGLLTAARTGLGPTRSITLPITRSRLRLAAPRRSRGWALRLGLRPRAAAKDARQQSARLGLAPGALHLSAQFLNLLVEALDRLLLHVDQLCHRVGCVRLAADFVGDEALRLRIARLVRRLFEALENPRDDLAFLAVHDVSLRCVLPRFASSCKRTIPRSTAHPCAVVGRIDPAMTVGQR